MLTTICLLMKMQRGKMEHMLVGSYYNLYELGMIPMKVHRTKFVYRLSK